jgi:hypothetical protein
LPLSARVRATLATFSSEHMHKQKSGLYMVGLGLADPHRRPLQ